MPDLLGRERQPSISFCSPLFSMISPLIASMKPCSSPTSISTTRRRIPICTAARPTPSAFINVSFISLSRRWSFASNDTTGLLTFWSTGSSSVLIFLSAISFHLKTDYRDSYPRRLSPFRNNIYFVRILSDFRKSDF